MVVMEGQMEDGLFTFTRDRIGNLHAVWGGNVPDHWRIHSAHDYRRSRGGGL
jgi:hypothetical protein